MWKLTEYEMHKLDTLITCQINKWKEILEDEDLHNNYDGGTISNIKENIEIHYTILNKLKIINDITGDCDYYLDLNYDNWKQLLSDANMENREEYDEVLYEEFTEEELDRLWRDSHKDYKFE